MQYTAVLPMKRRWFVIACYGASGAAALIYQVAWTRLFTLELGHTTAASSTVLAAFMGGLAAGAWIGGRVRADSPARLLRTYAALELFIAAFALILPGSLQVLVPALASAYADGRAPAMFGAARVAVSVTLIGIPAVAMGATFPLAVQWLATQARGSATTSAGVLYAANTAGAALGAVSAGFWWIPAIGLRATTWIGIALNIAAAAIALWLAQQQPVEVPREATPRATSRERGRATPVPRPVLACAAAVISGFLSLVYEVAWTRLLAMVLGPTTYAFGTMVASFITGIAIGSFLATAMVRRAVNAAAWLGVSLVLTALSASVAAWFAASRVPMTVALAVNAGRGFDSIVQQQALVVAFMLLPTSIALGASFVLAVATANPSPIHAGKHAAIVYVANTVGAVVGALSAGFVLIPSLGLQPTFVHISHAGVVAGVVVLTLALLPHSRTRALMASLAAAVTGIGVFAATPDWDRQLLASGAYKYSRNVDAAVLDAALRAGTLEYYKEGAAGTVSVRRLAGSRSLAIDGKVDASNGGDMLTQRLLGVLPTLLHAAPRDALVIGLGSGVTADAVLASAEVERLDIVELSPEVVEASAFFDRENRSVLKQPGVRLLVADGRSHLRLTTRQYDVIVSEPSNPWMAGVAALFTREFFDAARARLRPGGVFCQWAHTYEIAQEDLQSIVRTFASVFPDGTMWLVADSDLLLIGSRDGRLDSRIAALPERSRLASVPALLADVGVSRAAAPFVLLSLFAGGPEDLKRFGGQAPLQTDDRMALEFTAARAMYAPPEGNAATLRQLADPSRNPETVSAAIAAATAADWTARGTAALRAQAFVTARESFRRALALDRRSLEALRGATDAAAGARTLAEETEWLKAMATAQPDNAAVYVELSHALAVLDNTEGAIAAAMEAARIDPARPEPLEQLASIFGDAGDAGRLTPIADELVRRFPGRDEGRYYQAVALFLAGRAIDAERPLRALLTANPRHAKGQNLLGVMCASHGNQACARAAFAASLELNPRDPSLYVNLGLLSLAGGNAQEAVRLFREALTIDPASEAARRGLEEALKAER